MTAATEAVSPASSAGQEAAVWRDRAPRAALWTFVLIEVVGGAVWVWVGRHQWFFLDEWDFLVTRSLGDPQSLLRSHFEHWTTLPVVAYRLLWQVFGIRTYLPYQLMSIGSHLAVAALMRIVMRRAGVGPWLSTLVATIIVFFGAGNANIIWAFQITFTGGLLFGVVHLLLADHDGRIDRRDWLGLLAGLLGLLCAAPGLLLVGVVGLAALARRGWRAAAFHTVPLLVIYGLWAASYSERSFDSPNGLPRASVWSRFVAEGLAESFRAISQVPYLSWVLAVLLIGGLAVAAHDMGVRAFRVQAAVPVALLVGAVLFLVLTGYGRAGFYGADRARESRYLYMVAAMALPAVGLAAEALVRRWRYATPVVLLVLLAGLPGNVAASGDRNLLLRGDPNFVLTLPTVDGARAVPPDVHPGGFFAPDLTIGWLLDGVSSGRVPAPDVENDRLTSRARGALFFVQKSAGASALEECVELTQPVDRHLEAGESLHFRDGALRIIEVNGGSRGADVAFDESRGQQVNVLAGPIDVRLSAGDLRPTKLCS